MVVTKVAAQHPHLEELLGRPYAHLFVEPKIPILYPERHGRLAVHQQYVFFEQNPVESWFWMRDGDHMAQTGDYLGPIDTGRNPCE